MDRVVHQVLCKYLLLVAFPVYQPIGLVSSEYNWQSTGEVRGKLTDASHKRVQSKGSQSDKQLRRAVVTPGRRIICSDLSVASQTEVEVTCGASV